MARHTIMILLSGALALGCKGKTVVQQDEGLQREVEVCKQTLEETKKLAQALQDENARLMRASGGSEIVVALEGNLFTVRPGKPGETRPIDDKAVAAASKEFYDLVAKSRGAIQKCYEQVLKKDSNLQARTVTLTVQATFSGQGTYQSSSFHASQNLGDTFDSCMKQIASKWSLPQNAQTMTFKAQVSLTPS